MGRCPGLCGVKSLNLKLKAMNCALPTLKPQFNNLSNLEEGTSMFPVIPACNSKAINLEKQMVSIPESPIKLSHVLELLVLNPSQFQTITNKI